MSARTTGATYASKIRPGWLRQWSSNSVTQAGIAGASWSVAGSFARGLLPRTPVQQAVATGATAAIHYELTATAWAALQALAAKPGSSPTTRATLAISAAGIACGVGASAAANTIAQGSMAASAVSTAGRITSFAALAGGASVAWDALLHKGFGLTPRISTTLVPSIATGALVVATSIYARHRRARDFGLIEPERHAVSGGAPNVLAKAAGLGIATGLGLAAATSGEQFIAQQLERGLNTIVGRKTGSAGALAVHGVLLTGLTFAGAAALGAVTQRIQRRDDIVEPAYPEPPTSNFVSCGPRSVMPFDSIGKEGRRFVLMALDREEITSVMGVAAIDPIRVVGGFESASTVQKRVELIMEDMERLGAFDRSIIAVGSPTGVGYFNYSIAEALEYLSLGDCAIVVPQYALVPSALALTQTRKAEELTRLLLQQINSRIQSQVRPPKIFLIGESLGANVALDCAIDASGHPYVPVFDELGVDGGLYLGVPFRTKMWKAWRYDRMRTDPHYELELVSEPKEIGILPAGTYRHLMVVHHDDPVNKFGFRMILQPPWWMGPPADRPPLFPKESKYRPFTTFILATVDLLNGMQSKPGTFVRKGHDYRIDIRLGLERTFGFHSTYQQAQAIEAALREREKLWATKRMVARKLDRARRSIEKQLTQWGDNAQFPIADLDPNLGPEPKQPAQKSWRQISQISAPPGA